MLSKYKHILLVCLSPIVTSKRLNRFGKHFFETPHWINDTIKC